MADQGCHRGHVWVTYPNAKISVCKNCGDGRPVFKLPDNDPLMVAERSQSKGMKKMANLEALASGMNEEIKRQNIILAAYAEEIKRLRGALEAIQIKLVGAHDGAVIPVIQDFVHSALNQKE